MPDAAHLQDIVDIGSLIGGWIHRDTADWEALRTLFHPDGVIEIGWFKGLFSDFVDASVQMHRKAEIQSRHLLAPPALEVRGHRAIAETAAVLTGVNNRLRLGFTGHTRFLDLVERRGDAWKIYKRSNVYDMCFFSFPAGPVDIDQEALQRHPWEYAPLAYVLEASGQRVASDLPTRGSDSEAVLRQTGREWLHGG